MLRRKIDRDNGRPEGRIAEGWTVRKQDVLENGRMKEEREKRVPGERRKRGWGEKSERAES